MNQNSLPVVMSFLRSIEFNMTPKAMNRLKRLIVEDYQAFLDIYNQWQNQ